MLLQQTSHSLVSAMMMAFLLSSSHLHCNNNNNNIISSVMAQSTTVVTNSTSSLVKIGTIKAGTCDGGGGGNYPLILMSSEVSYLPPDDTSTGGYLQVHAQVKSPVTISKGRASSQITALGRNIYSEDEDFCKLTKCPIKPGSTYIVSKTVGISVKPAPGVDVNARILAFDGDQVLGCFQIFFDFENAAVDAVVIAVAGAVAAVTIAAAAGSMTSSVASSLGQISSTAQGVNTIATAPIGGGGAPLPSAPTAPAGFGGNPAAVATPSGPAGFGGAGAGPTAATAPTGPATFGAGAGAGGAGPVGTGGPSGPAMFGGGGVGSGAGASAATAAAPTGPATFGAGHVGTGAAAPTTATGQPAAAAGGPSAQTAAGPAAGDAGTGQAANNATAPQPSATQTPQSGPYFFDIIHYFQFITLTGQLQLNYPTIFLSFTKLFNFANGGIKIPFIINAVDTWVNYDPSLNNTAGIGSVTSSQDIGLTAFITASGVQPSVFFPFMLISLVIIAAFGVVFSLVVSGVIEGVVALHKWRTKSYLDASTERRIRKKKLEFMGRFSIANLVRAWMIAQYPLTLATFYWISNFSVTYLAPKSVTALAILILTVLCVGFPLVAFILTYLRPETRAKLHTDRAYLDTIGPLYDLYKPETTFFAYVSLAYIFLQAVIVGGFPRNSPQALADTMGTPQWIQSLVQPLLLLVLEVVYIIAWRKWDPLADRFSSLFQYGVCYMRLLVLLVLCALVTPEYKRALTSDKVEDLNANYIGSNVWFAKNVISYIVAAAHSIMLITLIVLTLRKLYLWLKIYIANRKRLIAEETSKRKSGFAVLRKKDDANDKRKSSVDNETTASSSNRNSLNTSTDTWVVHAGENMPVTAGEQSAANAALAIASATKAAEAATMASEALQARQQQEAAAAAATSASAYTLSSGTLPLPSSSSSESTRDSFIIVPAAATSPLLFPGGQAGYVVDEKTGTLRASWIGGMPATASPMMVPMNGSLTRPFVETYPRNSMLSNSDVNNNNNTGNRGSYISASGEPLVAPARTSMILPQQQQVMIPGGVAMTSPLPLVMVMVPQQQQPAGVRTSYLPSAANNLTFGTPVVSPSTQTEFPGDFPNPVPSHADESFTQQQDGKDNKQAIRSSVTVATVSSSNVAEIGSNATIAGGGIGASVVANKPVAPPRIQSQGPQY